MNLKNFIMLTGRLTKDVTVNTNSNGTSYASFSVAVDRAYNSKNSEKKVDYIDCVAFNGTAAFVQRNFGKGSPITIQGNLQNNNYTDKNGTKHYEYVVVTETVEFPIINAPKTNNVNGTDVSYANSIEPPIDDYPISNDYPDYSETYV